MIRRHATRCLLDALRDTPVVHLQGARQTGKSTLAQSIAAGQPPRTYLTLDTAAVRAAAQADPEGFIAGLDGPAVIDEVQRAPALALAIKATVDADRRAGQFLLTGSAGILSLPRLAESLAGIAGPRFVRGVVLYTGTAVVPFGERLHALPIDQLWA